MAERRNSLLDFFTGDTSDDLTYRSSMLPIGTYRGDDGRERAGLAWPQLALDAVDAMEAPGELLFGEGLDRDESQRRASIAAGLMMGGGLAAPRPGNALAMGGGRVVDDALPMDQASRMARAREMGFDTDTTWYHGTPAGSFVEPRSDLFVTRSTDTANDFAMNGGSTAPAAVYPLRVKGDYFDPSKAPDMELLEQSFPKIAAHLRGLGSERPTWSTLERPELKQWAKDNGYAGLTVREGGKNNRMIFDPRNIRSVNASFDPAKADSANLLAANASPSTGLMSLYGYDDEYDPFLNF